MSCRETVSQWEQMVSMHMPQLSGPQTKVLAFWSAAMILGKSCGTTTAAYWLACILGGNYNAWRQRLREWCYDAGDKKGKQREEISVVTCFAPLLRWILTWWAPGEHRLALAMDASTLSDRFTVLAISVMYRGIISIMRGQKSGERVEWITVGSAERNQQECKQRDFCPLDLITVFALCWNTIQVISAQEEARPSVADRS